MELRTLVQEKFSEPQKCYGHCDQQSTLKFLDDEKVTTTAVYSCPGAYISKVIVYGESVDLDQVLGYVQSLVGKEQDVREEDIRVASRYPWDLGIDTGNQERVMGAAYWTQNYRRTKSDDPNRVAVFLCGDCRSVFSQPMSSNQTLCGDCRSA
jgi:hypothetical protein